jgi:hypothetical protein
MKQFLLRQSPHESQRCPYILGAEVVVALNCLESHAARQADSDGKKRWDLPGAGLEMSP